MIRVQDAEVVSHAGKTAALSDYFKSIIGVPGQSAPCNLQRLFQNDYRPNVQLVGGFTVSETKAVIEAMNKNSASGPDGFGTAFYSAAWPSVKDSFMSFMDAFHRGQTQLECINRSHMVLLPKKPDAVDVDAFRPICLQNCALKILSKVLTTRLQKEIPHLIDIHQTGFIRGRSITDTFIYALELIQVCQKKEKTDYCSET